MWKTAEPSAGCRQQFFSVVLLIIVLCLGIHFLLEDPLLDWSMDAATQSCSHAEVTYEEMEHQDDLGLTVRSPEFNPSNHPPGLPTRSLRPGLLLAFSIPIPPKIA